MGVEVDAACAVGNASRDTTESAVGVVGGTEVPKAVFSVAGEADATGVGGRGQSCGKSADSSWSACLAVDAPCIGEGGRGFATDRIEIFFGREGVLVEFD